MENQMNSPVSLGGSASALETNRVLRNTFLLLALSMIPTVVGAWAGVAFNVRLPGGIWGLAIFLAGVFGFQFAISKFRDSSIGVVILLLFTLFMGFMLAGLLSSVLKFKNGPSLIMMAFGGTAAILTGMSLTGMMIKSSLTGLGKFLNIGMWSILALAIIGIVFKINGLTLVIIAASLIIFSLYIMYDVNQIVTGGETNYIIAATQLYIDVFAVFQNLLALLGIFGGEKD